MKQTVAQKILDTIKKHSTHYWMLKRMSDHDHKTGADQEPGYQTPENRFLWAEVMRIELEK